MARVVLKTTRVHMSILTRRSYTAGHFELRIDGYEPTAYVNSVEGGWNRIGGSDDAGGGKHVAAVDIDPITVEFGVPGARDALKWTQGSWNGNDNQPRNGQITHADFNMRTMFEQHFYGALITETTFPTLDGASKAGGYIKCKLQPGRVETTAFGTPGPQVSSNARSLQKMWTPSAFRLSIDGVDGMQYANRIDSFTVALDTRKFCTSAGRSPEIVPLRLRFPKITGTISLQYADKLLKWHRDYARRQGGSGMKDSAAQKSGALEFLSPDRKQTLFSINLCEVAPLYVGVSPSRANEAQVKRLMFELSVDRMTLEGSSVLGFV